MLLIGLVLLLVIYYGVQAALRTSPRMPMQVIAHRGGADLAPENTMAASSAKRASGCSATSAHSSGFRASARKLPARARVAWYSGR